MTLTENDRRSSKVISIYVYMLINKNFISSRVIHPPELWIDRVIFGIFLKLIFNLFRFLNSAPNSQGDHNGNLKTGWFTVNQPSMAFNDFLLLNFFIQLYSILRTEVPNSGSTDLICKTMEHNLALYVSIVLHSYYKTFSFKI